jgi:hypothetical protein
MDYPRLKSEIKEIADIAASMPEGLQEKCFEVLLKHFLCETTPIPARGRDEQQAKDLVAQDGLSHTDIPMTTSLRLFLRKTDIAIADLQSVLMLSDNDVHFIHEPSTSIIAEGQIQWALLLALKQAILKNDFSVDPEDVRSICQEKGFYDKANFATNFKNAKYSKFFKGPMKRQGERQALSDEGQTELARIIKSLVQEKK